MIITIDGPAGTGKSTVAQKVAEELGFSYVDTGAMYRAITYEIVKQQMTLSNTSSLEKLLAAFQFKVERTAKGGKKYFVDDEDVTEKIREGSVTSRVSEVSAHPIIRRALVEMQREIGKKGNTVFEGRDMGTVVFPHADVKIFLTARPAVRALRRYLEIKDKKQYSQEQILEEIMARDHFDATREISPLKKAEDAHLIDTSDLTIEQVVDKIIALIKRP